MKQPGFIGNTPDDTHCVQACVGMVLQSLLPDRKFSMDDLEKFTGYVTDKGAWEMEELLNYGKQDLEAKAITHVSYSEFAKRGFEYLEELEGPETTEWAKQNTGDIELEKKRALAVDQLGVAEKRIPTKADIKSYLDQGYLVMLAVNSRKLNNKPGFSGHRVLVYGHDEEGAIVHDPGSPPHEAWHVNWNSLEEAWADPKETSKLLVAVRKISQ